MKVFIVGATGFLGYHSTLELTGRGHEVSGVSLPSSSPLPPIRGVDVRFQDINAMGDSDVIALLRGHDAVVFAAGADDRTVPPAPAYEFFRRANVDACTRVLRCAREAGVSRAIVLGSYFVHFHRKWPELRMAERHPYIRSRLEQEEAAFAEARGQMSVSVLELPYIFGTLPGRIPLWLFLIDMLRSSRSVYFPRGGTTMVTVRQVAQAVAGAVERGMGGTAYAIGGRNMGWVEFLGKLLLYMGERKTIVTIPTFAARIYGWTVRRSNRRAGKEGGLDPVSFMDVQSRETFIDPAPAMAALGYEDDDLDAAIRATVEACVKA
jgi:dihydroflavonol-4-reductase